MANSDYSFVCWSVSYAPDPTQPRKFKKVSEGISAPKLRRCAWCGGECEFEKLSCQNCGGPRTEEKNKSPYCLPKPIVTKDHN